MSCIFKVGGEYYQGTVNIVQTERGLVLKDVTQIENVTQAISSSYGDKPPATILRDVSMDSIRQEGGKSNGKFDRKKSGGKPGSTARSTDAFGQSGQKALVAGFRKGQDAAAYYAGFANYYQAGLAGVEPEKAYAPYGRALDSAQKFAAWTAGQNDAKTYRQQELETAKRAVSAGKDSGLSQDDYRYAAETYGAETAQLLHQLGEKLRDAFRALIDKLTGREKQQAQSAEARLTAALEAGAKRAGELSTAAQWDVEQKGKPQYDIKFDEHGAIAVVDGHVSSDRAATFEYLQSLISKENVFSTILRDAQPVYIGKDLPGEYTQSEATKALFDRTRAVKFRASSILGDMLLIADDGTWKEDIGGKHGLAAQNGWYYYKTRFAVPVYKQGGVIDHYNRYNAELIIRNDADGKSYLYDVTKIQKMSSGIAADGFTEPTIVTRASSDDGSVPHPEEEVNPNFSLKGQAEMGKIAELQRENKRLKEQVEWWKAQLRTGVSEPAETISGFPEDPLMRAALEMAESGAFESDPVTPTEAASVQPRDTAHSGTAPTEIPAQETPRSAVPEGEPIGLTVRQRLTLDEVRYAGHSIEQVGMALKRMGPEAIRGVINQGLQASPDAGSHIRAQMLQRKLDAGQDATPSELGHLYDALCREPTQWGSALGQTKEADQLKPAEGSGIINSGAIPT